ncbi:MAG TPA: HAMP domain-containing sensor histidine kinase, partial [Elusimicrobiales bacterium]|nr:HAMP domain-containing sensor histidine kinase [Elusimicrobiales bacterium]
DGGTLKLSLAPFKPADVLNRTVELFSNQASEHGIRFKVSVQEPDLQVYGDVNRVFQILVNLVSNSLKFTPQGGEIELGARRNGIAAEFFVRDNGCGIPESKQFKLFTEFYQINEAEPLRGFKGLGIGLALCKKLVQAQGGFIT